MSNMYVTIIKKGEQRQTAIPYETWLRDYVNKGVANQCQIVSYPDLSKIKILNGDGFVVHEKIFELKDALTLIKTNPSSYRKENIDIKKLKQKHLKRSTRIYRASSMSFINPFKYSFSFLNFCTSLSYWETHRIERNPWVTLTKKRIAWAITTSIVIFGILVQLYIAYRQGVDLF